jgi:hypothetical protein
VHANQGQLVAVGEVHAGLPEGIGVGIVPRDGQSVFEMERTPDLANKPLKEIHNEFRVDVAAKSLTKR